MRALNCAPNRPCKDWSKQVIGSVTVKVLTDVDHFDALAAKDVALVTRFIVIDSSKVLHVVNHNESRVTRSALGVSDHVLERAPSERARSADRIIHMEAKQSQIVIIEVLFDRLLLIRD